MHERAQCAQLQHPSKCVRFSTTPVPIILETDDTVLPAQ